MKTIRIIGIAALGLGAVALGYWQMQTRSAVTSVDIIGNTQGVKDLNQVQSFGFQHPEFVTENRRTFMDFRYDIILTQGDHSVTVPGYWSASDPSSSATADAGSYWTANFRFDRLGYWTVERRFCQGEGVAIAAEPSLGRYECETDTLRFFVEDFSNADPIRYPRNWRNYTVDGETLTQGDSRYLTVGGKPFIKTGAGSPENILAYADFDGTYDAGGAEFPALGDDQLHNFEPHLKDARSDDPTWNDGEGAALLGLFNYYEEVGVNSQYLVGMNVHGDGADVFPYVRHDDPYVFDVSKLSQWQRVFEHANRRGVAIHFLFTETENESFFEVHDGLEIGEDFAPSRKLYYREMVARFGHLPLMIWNLGEENGVVGNSGSDPYRQPTSAAQRGRFADFITSLDHRNHPVISHNWPDSEDETYGPLLGRESFSGISLQVHHNYFDKAMEWTQRSEAAGRPWMVSVDEPLGWEFGARPDSQTDRRDELLTVLWPSLLGGATGVEWYFGWQNNAPTSDLSNEDQRTRDRLWRESAAVRRFFETLPLTEMTSSRDGEVMVLSGAGYRVSMRGETVTFTAPGEAARQLNPFDPE